MKLQNGFEDPSLYQDGFVAIGNFDGVHRGHQSIVSSLVSHARKAAVPAVVFTFDPHPIAIMRPKQAPPSLSTTERKAELLGEYDVDCVIAYPTSRELLALPPEDFFETIVLKELKARGLVEGPNFFFGYKRAGNIETLGRLCDEAGLMLEVVPPQMHDRCVVSSSEVRGKISTGDLSDAVNLLGHPYQIRGTVTQGAKRGREIGFPTANLEDVVTLLPPNGVYAGVVQYEDHSYPAAVHLGPNPTFDEQRRKLEVHLIGFEGDLYGKILNVDLLDRVRDIIRFENINELRTQLQRDTETVCKIVGQ